MRVTVRYDDSQIRNALLTLRSDAPLAVARALNKSIATVRTQGAREMARDLGIAQAPIRALLARGTRLATRSDLRASVTVTGKRIPLIEFKARQTRAGVSYRLPGGRSVAPGAFIATMKSGHEGVFKRRGPSRLPIDELRGPSLPHVFGKAAIEQVLRRVAREVMPKNLAHETAFLLRRRGA